MKYKLFKPDPDFIKWYDRSHPLDYAKVFSSRIEEMKRCESDPIYRQATLELCKNDPVRFINDWCVTYDPRNKSKGLPTLMPFVLFEVQEEYVYWLANLILVKGESGVVDKSRDMGASCVACAISVWLLLFHSGVAIGWGSRKADLVDRHGDSKTIFYKIRQILEYLPAWMKPEKKDFIDKLMLITNADNDSSIVGEAGDNIGRGGRTSVYFKDESSFYENPVAIENALGENTDVQIDISTHNGTGTVFYQACRNYPKHRKFILDWSMDPRKGADWLEKKRADYIMKNNLAGFKQEILRDPTGGITNAVIDSVWLDACVDAHIALGIEPTGEHVAGLDVADEGGDRNSRALGHGCLVYDIKAWDTDVDVTKTSDDLFKECMNKGITKIKYDSIGVGASCKGDFRKCNEKTPSHKRRVIVPFAGSGKVRNKARRYKKAGVKTDRKNEDMFSNLKAQSWWHLRDLIHNTYLWVVEGIPCPEDEIISFSSSMENWVDLRDELLQPTFDYTNNGKILIEKKPKGAMSPNMADSVMILKAPINPLKLKAANTRGGLY